MSLDFYIESPLKKKHCECRECGDEHEHWTSDQYFSRNITHNLGRMAQEAGIYDALWHPENLNITRAGDLAPIIHAGLEKMEDNPEHYKQFNSPNGWGLYEHFVPFVRACFAACEDNPEGIVRTST